MKNKFFYILMTLVLGCSSVPTSATRPPKAKAPQAPSTAPSAPSAPLSRPPEAKKKIPFGTIFAKTIFEGVVKTSYVRFLIVDLDDVNKTYQLYIGDKARQKNFPWKIQTVSPGYFFIELPPGKYQIQAVSIPVGTALATERMDVKFEVVADQITYLGTLKMTGTKEKLRFGGVPVINPGFEFRLELMDERKQAFGELHQRFPDRKGKAVVNLFKINKKSNMDNGMPKIP